MTLRELIEKLEALDPATVWRPGFGRGRSWRGSYEQVAFEPVEQATVGEMLAHARAMNGATIEGYKGGTYRVDLDTDCNVARWGEYGGNSDDMGVWWATNVETAALRAEVERLMRLIRGPILMTGEVELAVQGAANMKSATMRIGDALTFQGGAKVTLTLVALRAHAREEPVATATVVRASET